MEQRNELTETINNASRMLTLLWILEDCIRDYNEKRDLVSISMWSDEAFECMIHIEVDNGL